uniref:Gustatory receptor n=1 Tax=Tetranychus urticae TaxID=32264 RepID=A0A158P592_TETUR
MKQRMECKKTMVAKVRSVLSKQKSFFRKIYSFEIPDSKEFDETVCNKIRQTEKLTIFFQAVRNGVNQSDSVGVNTFGFRRFSWKDWLISISCFISVIRCGILGKNTNESVAIYLGDPLFRVKDGHVLLLWISVAILVTYSFREWLLVLEAKGKFKVLSVWNICCNGFNPVDLQMNKLNTKRFRFTIYLVSLTIYWVMLIIPLFCTLGSLSLVLTNPLMYRNPKLAFLALLWAPTLSLSLTVVFSAIIGFGWYIMCSLYFHLYRLRDQIDCADILLNNSKHGLFAEKDIQLFCSKVIQNLNNLEEASHKLRYVLLWYFSVLSSAFDFDLFIGTIIRVYNSLLCNFATTAGFSVLISVGIFGHIFGSFITQLGRLTIRLHQLSCKNKLSMQSVSKVLEIMDRAAGPYNGIKIGDLLTLEKRFFVSFILENISILMLFTVNIGPYFESYKSSA